MRKLALYCYSIKCIKCKKKKKPKKEKTQDIVVGFVIDTKVINHAFNPYTDMIVILSI